jgi:hypothetical protein
VSEQVELEEEETMESAETTQTSEKPTEAVTAESSAAAADGGEDLAKVRELVLRAHPEVVPELVQGSSVDELLASVEPARSAYQRVAEAVRGGQSSAAPAATDATSAPAIVPPAVPAGGAANVIDPSALAPMTKIAQGLAARKR